MTTAVKVLTRAESQERTRARIVAAATRLFLRDGFGATSLETIGERAGYTRGAVYSNFESKTELGIAVIDWLYTAEQRRLAAAVESAGDPQAKLDALAAWADQTIGDRAWTRLESEVAAASKHDKPYRAAAAARYARLRAGAAEILEEALGEDLGIPTELLATAMVGLSLGIGVQRAADPKVKGSAMSDFLQAVLPVREALAS
jgi:AcrR family transcriptional regulator